VQNLKLKWLKNYSVVVALVHESIAETILVEIKKSQSILGLWLS